MDEQKLRDSLGQQVEVPDMVNRKLENTYSELVGKQRPTKRKKFRPVRTALIAAALVLGAALCMAAGVPYQIYNFLSGGSIAVYPASGRCSGIIGGAKVTTFSADDMPLVLEDGRLWFVNGEERTDITDLIDENTPYIYENVDPATGNKGYLILGGTPENFGWAEYARLDDASGLLGINHAQDYVILDGERIPRSELTSEQIEQIHSMSEIGEDGVDRASSVKIEIVYQPWLKAAFEQLGIENY